MKGRKLRDQGIQLVLDNEPEPWKVRARWLIEEYAREAIFPFNADDLQAFFEENGLEKPHHGNAFGGVILGCLRDGIIFKSGKWSQSTRPKRHANYIPWYVSGFRQREER